MTIKDRAKNRLDPEHDVDADQGIGLAFLNANPSRLRIVVAVAKQFKQNLLQGRGTSIRAVPGAARPYSILTKLAKKSLVSFSQND